MVAYSFKARFVAPICAGLGRDLLLVKGISLGRDEVVRPKTQTIRAMGKRRHAIEGETLQLYYAMRTKQCQQIGVARCVRSRPISIKFGARLDVVEIMGEKAFGDRPWHIGKLDDFAMRDGFKSWDAFLQFWNDEHDGIVSRHGTFNGMLIQWEPINGENN